MKTQTNTLRSTLWGRYFLWAALLAATLAVSGCYTVLQGPQLASTVAENEVWASASDLDADLYGADDYADTDAYGDEVFGRDDFGRTPYGRDPYNRDSYVRGYPVMGAATGYGLYGFGSPFAYGPGLGSAYSYGYGGYGPSYGPYGYGYDPYYSGSRGYGSSVPPGYELVTARELANLRTENASLRNSTGVGAVPTVNQQALQRQKQSQAERAWEQRASAGTRKSTDAYRTPKASSTASSTGKVTKSSSGTSSKPASSSSKSSGSSAAKRSKTRRR